MKKKFLEPVSFSIFFFFNVIFYFVFANHVNKLCFPTLVEEYRWCCISDAEMSKCQHLANVTSQIAWNISITCVHGRNVTNCIRMVGNGIADVITLGEEQIYQAGMCE